MHTHTYLKEAEGSVVKSLAAGNDDFLLFIFKISILATYYSAVEFWGAFLSEDNFFTLLINMLTISTYKNAFMLSMLLLLEKRKVPNQS